MPVESSLRNHFIQRGAERWFYQPRKPTFYLGFKISGGQHRANVPNQIPRLLSRLRSMPP